MERGITPVELKSSLEELLRLTTMTIATVGGDGEPHAAAVYFACDDQLEMYFFSDAHSQHTQDATKDSRAAAAVHPECSGWQDIRGLQMRGSVELVQAQDEWQQAWKLYQAKFPFVTDLQEIVALNLLHKFVPIWIRWLDNRRGFGFKQEWECSEEQRSGINYLTWTQSIGGKDISGSSNG